MTILMRFKFVFIAIAILCSILGVYIFQTFWGALFGIVFGGALAFGLLAPVVKKDDDDIETDATDILKKFWHWITRHTAALILLFIPFYYMMPNSVEKHIWYHVMIGLSFLAFGSNIILFIYTKFKFSRLFQKDCTEAVFVAGLKFAGSVIIAVAIVILGIYLATFQPLTISDSVSKLKMVKP